MPVPTSAEVPARGRPALLPLAVVLGVLIATVAVTGGLIAGSMRSRPVTLAVPLRVYPVTALLAGQCPAGTRGITAQSATGYTCYQLTNGIAIRKVSELRVQRGRTAGAYDVAIDLRSGDKRAFANLTQGAVGKYVAFVTGDRLVTAPRVETPVRNGKIIITGPGSRADAEKLIREMRGSR